MPSHFEDGKYRTHLPCTSRQTLFTSKSQFMHKECLRIFCKRYRRCFYQYDRNILKHKSIRPRYIGNSDLDYITIIQGFGYLSIKQRHKKVK